MLYGLRGYGTFVYTARYSPVQGNVYAFKLSTTAARVSGYLTSAVRRD